MSASGRDALLERVMDHFIAHGVGDVSLRALASEIGTSHRMLIYHFGSREGLLEAAVAQIWQSQLDAMADISREHPGDIVENAWRYWTMLADRSAVAPFIFEVSAQAMHGALWSDSFRAGTEELVDGLARGIVGAGVDSARALVLARLLMAVLRGSLWELRISGDRKAADAMVRAFLDAHSPELVSPA